MIKKAWLFLSSPILLSPALIVSCNNNEEWRVPKTNTIAANKKQGIQEINNLIDSAISNEPFLKDIEKYANDDSILFYNISLVAVAHRYVPIAHLMNVLQINKNKQVYVFVNTKSKFIPSFSDNFKQSHPNLKIIEYEAQSDLSNGEFEYGYGAIEAYKTAIQNDNLDKSKIVLTTDDYYFLNRLYAYANSKSIDEEGFVNDYLLFFDLKEVNMIADGTGSIKFYNNTMFDYMNYNQELFKYTDSKFNDAIDFVKYFSSLSEAERISFINDEKKMQEFNLDITKILYFLMIASKNNDSLQKAKFNYYVPALQMIVDTNNTTSPSLSHNDEYDYFFNPYNSQNLNFIELIAKLNSDMNREFLLSIGLNQDQILDIDNYKNEFDNSYNIVYSGSKIDNNFNSLNEQATALISIYNENYEYKRNIKIWFKAHPRELDNYQDLIKNKIISLGYPEIANSIYFLNKSVPMEAFICKPFMKSDKANNREVKFYISYSTIGLYLYANKQQNDLSRIIVTESDKKYINQHFGSFKQSILFPESKTISLVEFANLYNFKTTINPNMNYVIFDERNNATFKWDMFKDYAKWPFLTRLNYKITFKLSDGTKYEFTKNEIGNSYDSGIILTEKSKIRDMIFSMNFKSYTLDVYQKDDKAKEVMDYNLNLIKPKREYAIANVDIEFLNSKNQWEIFSNPSEFIILKDYL